MNANANWSILNGYNYDGSNKICNMVVEIKTTTQIIPQPPVSILKVRETGGDVPPGRALPQLCLKHKEYPRY